MYEISWYELDYFISSEKGDIEGLKKCINLGVNINSQNNRDKFTALMISIREHNDNISEYLINIGININLKNDRGDSALILASSLRNNKILHILIEKGADVNTQNFYGTTALHVVSYCGYIDIVKILFKANPNILDIRDKQGRTAIMSAVTMKSSMNVVKFLVENGAKLDFQNIWSETVFTIASWTNMDKVMKDFLIEYYTRQCYECNDPLPLDIACFNHFRIKKDPFVNDIVNRTCCLIVLKMLYELNIFLDMDTMYYVVQTILYELNNY